MEYVGSCSLCRWRSEFFFFIQMFVVGFERCKLRWNREHNGHPGSSKVLDFGTNRKRVCDFLLAISGIIGAICPAQFRDIAGFLCWKQLPHPYSKQNLGVPSEVVCAPSLNPLKEDWTSTGATIAILWIRACLDSNSQWTANRSLWPNIKGWRRRFQGFDGFALDYIADLGAQTTLCTTTDVCTMCTALYHKYQYYRRWNNDVTMYCQTVCLHFSTDWSLTWLYLIHFFHVLFTASQFWNASLLSDGNKSAFKNTIPLSNDAVSVTEEQYRSPWYKVD